MTLNLAPIYGLPERLLVVKKFYDLNK